MKNSAEPMVKFIKTKVILAIILWVSQAKFYQVRTTKSKVIHVQSPIPKW